MWTDRKYVIIFFYVIEEITWASNTGSHNLITCPKMQVSTDTCLYWDVWSFDQALIILRLIDHYFVHNIRLRFLTFKILLRRPKKGKRKTNHLPFIILFSFSQQ